MDLNRKAPTTDFDSLSPRMQAVFRRLAPLAMVGVLALVAWHCFFDPKIRFLSSGPGDWIVYPLPPRAPTYQGIELTGAFRRSFVLPAKPATAILSMRCMTNGELRINGQVVSPLISPTENWKNTIRFDVGEYLHQGSNEISVFVTNLLGPPALSLELETDGFVLKSDSQWEVSVSGSEWKSAQLASATPLPGKGNVFAFVETTGEAFGRCWPWLCVFTVVSVCGIVLLEYLFRRINDPKSVKILRCASIFALAAAWVLLLVHNIPLMPAVTGFDARSHLLYVKYIQERGHLPTAHEGWEMFQAPLYYVTSAVLLNLIKAKVFQAAGVMALRYSSLVIGAINLTLVFMGLRLIFPTDWKKPLAGLVLATFLPAQIYMLHYPTNETMVAMFCTAGLYVGLLVLRARDPAWIWCGLLGVVLGLALLSKSSAVMIIPPVLGALALKLIVRRERRVAVWMGTIGGPLVIALLIGGWHYVKLWREFGDPFIGRWDPKTGEPWWQYKGFGTLSYYLSFGEALTRPFCSGLHSFWDGLYSTLWGDGLLGGKVDLASRPPWNYDLMAMGYFFALIPSALILTGLVRAIVGCYRAASLSWLMLLGAGALFAFAILNITLKLPSYEQAKAFFGLSALLPFCALGALGFEYWIKRGMAWRFGLASALGVWLITDYASFWIQPHNYRTELALAVGGMYLEHDPTGAFSQLASQYPDDPQAAVWMALLESRKSPKQAIQRLEDAARNHPTDAQIEWFLAQDFELDGRLDEALVHAERAVELAPEDDYIAQTRASLELHRKNYGAAVEAARYALSLNPSDRMTRFNLGLALAQSGQIPEAIQQFSAVVQAYPKWADAQYALGAYLSKQPGGQEEGAEHLQIAAGLNPTNQNWKATLNEATKGR